MVCASCVSVCVSVMDELRVGTEGDMQRHPPTTDLLIVGKGRRREIRTHYYSCKGKWELSACMSHYVMWGYSQGEKSKYASTPYAAISNVSVFPTAESSHFSRKIWSSVPWRLIILLNLSLRNTHLQSGDWTVLSGLFEVACLLHWSAVNFEHTYSPVIINLSRESIRML